MMEAPFTADYLPDFVRHFTRSGGCADGQVHVCHSHDNPKPLPKRYACDVTHGEWCPEASS